MPSQSVLYKKFTSFSKIMRNFSSCTGDNVECIAQYFDHLLSPEKSTNVVTTQYLRHVNV